MNELLSKGPVTVALGVLLGFFALGCSAQSGGTFTITKSVIAGGGGNSSGSIFVLDGTVGQPAAGTSSTGGAFRVTGGFWGGGDAAPISNVSISGRVTTPSGQGLRNAIVSLTDSNGVRRLATTSSFGIYIFENVPAGQTYFATIASKRYRFMPRTLQPNGSLTNVDFTGLE